MTVQSLQKHKVTDDDLNAATEFFKSENKPNEIEEYDKITLSALTICCTCD